MSSVSLKSIIEKQKLENLTPELDIKKIRTLLKKYIKNNEGR